MNKAINHPPAEEVKSHLAVFCTCGAIMYACRKVGMDKEQRRRIDHFWKKGYRQGLVSIEEVRGNFGCECGSHDDKGNQTIKNNPS